MPYWKNTKVLTTTTAIRVKTIYYIDFTDAHEILNISVNTQMGNTVEEKYFIMYTFPFLYSERVVSLRYFYSIH